MLLRAYKWSNPRILRFRSAIGTEPEWVCAIPLTMRSAGLLFGRWNERRGVIAGKKIEAALFRWS